MDNLTLNEQYCNFNQTQITNNIKLVTPVDISNKLISIFNEIVLSAVESGDDNILLIKQENGGRWPKAFIEYLQLNDYLIEDADDSYKVSWIYEFGEV